MGTWVELVDVSTSQTLTNKTLTAAALGDSTANTQTAGDSSTKVATTAFVATAAAAGDTTLTNGKIWVGNGSDAKAEVTLSGDVTMANTGAVTIADDSIESAMIEDGGVTYSKIQQVAANSVLVRDAGTSGVTSAKAVADTQVLIGDGTGFTAAALSGDATMTNAGVVTVTGATGDFSVGTSLKTATIDYTDGDLAMTIADGGAVTTSGDLTVTGNLKVAGTHITTTTEVLEIADNTLVLNSDLSTSADVDAGIVVERGTSHDNATFYWDEGDDRWRVGTNDDKDLSTSPTYGADVMQVRIDGGYNSSSEEVPVGHLQYHGGALYVRTA